MGKKRSELDSLYRSISEKFDVGTFEEFSNKMQTPEDRKRFYEVVLDRGIDLGDYSEYERSLGGVQGVSAQGSAGTSETSGQPSGSSAEPSLGNQPAQVPVSPTPEQVGEAVTDFEAQQIANVGNQYADRYVPEDSTVVTPINTSAGPSVAVLGDDGEIFNVIPPVDVVTQIPFDVSMRNTFSNLKHQIEGIDDRISLVAAETWEKLLGKELAKSWYDFSGRDIRQVKLDAYAELDRLESEMKQTASITGSLRAGDALGFLAASVNALSALGTTAIASISTGGVGLYTEMMGQSIYDFNKTRAEELGLTVEQLYDQGKAEFGVPATIGMLGGILEKVGFKGATRAFLAQLNSSATRKLVKAGLGANQEGVTEWLQTGLEAVNQMYAENPDASTFDVAEIFAKSLFSEEGLESYLMGAIGSASASGIGRATSHVVSRMVDRKRARDVENKMESIQAINQDLENTEMSPATATALESERDRLVSEVAEDISADAEQESQLSPQVRSEVEGLMGRLEELQSAIHDPNVSEETKSLLQSQAEQISSEIDSLISAEPESETVDAQASEYSGKTVSELESEYEALGQDLQNGMITQEEFDSKSDDIYNEMLSRKGEEEAERRLFEDRQARRQAEVDEAIRSFQENNPNVEVDLFEDTPDSVVRTFDRVERGLPTDPVALSETSDWLYAKYQEILAERDNPNRRHTIDQLNAIANQLGEDITILENYKYEQQGEQQIQSEAEASVVADETDQGVEATQTTESEAEQVAEVEQATLEAAETSPVRDDISSDESLGQPTSEVSSEAPVEAVSDGGVVGGVEQEVAPVSAEDVQSEREQSEVSLPVAERPVRITDDMPPKQPENARVKSLLRMLPRQDIAAMMGPANVEYRRDVIESITGKRPAKKDAGITNVRRAIADYLGIDLENTSGVDFSDMVRNWANSPDSSPKKSSRPSRQANRYVNSDISDSGASTPEEVTMEFAKRTDDPDLIADAYNYFMPNEPDYIEEGIANYLGGGRINRRDFNAWGDRNRATHSISSRWLDASDSQLGLDGMAQELSDQLGVEVTEQDFIDFIERYSGQREFNESKKSEGQIILEDRYAELTGRTLTPRIAKAAQRRLDAEITDRDLLESSPVFRELGITYEDVLDYEEFHRQSDQGGAENVPSQESVGGSSVADGGARPQRAKAKTPKTLLQGVADRLSKTGLAKSVKTMTSEQISEDLEGRSGASVQGQDVNGYVDSEGNIVINSDTAGLDTPIHEFAHVWERTIETQNPFLYQKGMELIQTEEGKPYVDHVKKTQPSLTGQALHKEALAQAIGDRGARLIESQKNSPIKQWLKDAWDFIAKMVGLSEMTASQVSKLTLQEFADAVAVDLLSGKSFAKMPNGDVVVSAPTNIISKEKRDFKNDFLERMRKKNGLSFQGNINDGTFSSEDFRDLIKFLEYSIEDGTIKTKEDFQDLASSIGLSDKIQIDIAWKATRPQPSETSTFRVADIPSLVTESVDITKMNPRDVLSQGQKLVDEGIVNPTELANSILTEPRAIQPIELAVLLAGEANAKKELGGLVRGIRDGTLGDYEYLGVTGDSAAMARMDVLNDAIHMYGMVHAYTANPQSLGLSMRSAVVDENFDIVQFEADAKRLGYMTPELQKKLDDLRKKYNEVSALLADKEVEIERINKELIEKNLKEAGSRKPKTQKVRNTNSLKDTVNSVLDLLDVTSFGLPDVSMQANKSVRFSINPNSDLSNAVAEAVSVLKDHINKNSLSLADAIEQAVDSINSRVGKGKWDEMKFRSTIINGVVDQGNVVYSKKPYVAKNGRLIVPGAYITQKVKDGFDTVDKLVEAVQADVGQSFSSHQIRSSISGYGYEASPKKNDLQRRVNQLKRMAYLSARIDDLRNGIRTFKKHPFKAKGKEITELEQELNGLLEEVPMTPEELAQYNQSQVNRKKKYLETLRKRYQERLDNEDFAPRTHDSKSFADQDPDVIKLREEMEAVREEYLKEKIKFELENRPFGDKAWDLFVSMWNLTRVQAGLDISALGVQGMLVTAYNPIDAARILKESMNPSVSKSAYDRYIASMKANPWYDIAIKGGLALQQKNIRVRVSEEQYGGHDAANTIIHHAIARPIARIIGNKKGMDKSAKEELATTITEHNPWEMANRNYDIILTSMRLKYFEELMRSQIEKRGLSEKNPPKEVVEQVADVVNTMTMASGIPFITGNKLASQLVSMGLYSAPKWYSGIKLATWMPFKLLATNRQLFNDIYGFDVKTGRLGIVTKGLSRLAMLTIIPAVFANMYWDSLDDEEKEEAGAPPMFYNPNVTTPYHSDFMKLMPNANTRIDLFNGMAGNITAASRIISGKYATSGSQKVRRLGESSSLTRETVLLQYSQNKMSPTLSPIYNYFMKTERDRRQAIERSFGKGPLGWALPMWYTGWAEANDASDAVVTNTILGTLGTFGLNYNVYGGAEFANGNGTDNKAVRNMYQNNHLSVYTPMEGTKTAYLNGEVRPIVGKAYKEAWKPSYDSFMTEASISMKDKITGKSHWEHKEGLVNSLKGQAEKYAEIKTAGVYTKDRFDRFSKNGTEYRLTESQYALKAGYIKEFMEGSGASKELRGVRAKVRAKLRAEGAQSTATPEYTQMLIDLQLYNKANSYANERLYQDMRRRKINLVTSADFTSDMNELPEE